MPEVPLGRPGGAVHPTTLATAAGLRHTESILAAALIAVVAPDPCPQDIAIEARIEAQTGRTVEDGRIRASIGVREVEEGISAMVDLTVDDTRIQRELLGESCEAVFDATALLASALLVADRPAVQEEPLADPVLAQPVIHPELPPAVQPAQASAPLPVSQSPPASTKTGPRVGIGATAGPTFGVLPAVTARVAVHGTLAWDRLQATAELAYATPRVSANTVVQMASSALRACAVLGDRLAGGPCLVAEAGAMHGRLRGGASRTVPWVAPGVGAHLRWMATRRVGLLLRADAQLSAVRPRFVFGVADGSTRVLHESARGTGQVTAGMTFFFDRD